MRKIDADHLKRWILSRVFKTQLSVADVIDQIDREDTIEPEIVRCRDCKYHHRDNNGAYYCERKFYGYGWGLDDFCSDAERRGDSNDRPN